MSSFYLRYTAYPAFRPWRWVRFRARPVAFWRTYLVVLLLTQSIVHPATAADGWIEWVDAFVALAADPGLSNVDRGGIQSRLLRIAAVKPDARSRCSESFEAGPESNIVKSGRVEMLAPAGEACSAFRFGMASLTLAERSSKQIEQLAGRLAARFGEPSVSLRGGLKTSRWQINEGRAVELECAELHPERQTAAVTLANVPQVMRPRPAGPRL